MDYQSEFDRWCENVSEPVLAAQLAEMRERADAQAIEDAFFQELEFGTEVFAACSARAPIA